MYWKKSIDTVLNHIYLLYAYVCVLEIRVAVNGHLAGVRPMLP